MSKAYFVDCAVVWSSLRTHGFRSINDGRVVKCAGHFSCRGL